MFVRILFRIGAVSSILPIFMVPALCTVAIGVLCGEMYTRAAVTVKRLVSSSQSPVFSQFSDTMSGIAVIRARSDMPRLFRERLAERMRTYATAQVANYNLNRWVAVRVDLLAASVLVSAAIIAVWKADVVGAGLVGFSLSNATGLSTAILNWVRSTNDLEVELQSVSKLFAGLDTGPTVNNRTQFQRVEEYTNLEPEEKIDGKDTQNGNASVTHRASTLPENWPKTGSIEFRNVTIRYDPDRPDILKDVNITIGAGERVAIVGRTGSGKSTVCHTIATPGTRNAD